MVEPVETLVRDYSAEQRIVKWLCWLSPVIAIVLVPVIHRYLLTILYLQSPAEGWDLSAAYRSKVSLATAAMFPSFMGVWWMGLKLQPVLDRSRLPWAAMLAGIAIPVCSLPFESSRLTWFFVEWVIPRTPNPSFARNTLYWEQKNFESTGPLNAARSIGLVGSSQTYQGFDLPLLSANLPDHHFEKNCLAGFGPMQYPFLWERIQERQFNVIVCQLSEFDFYREDTLPVSRLRWASGMNGIKGLWSALTSSQRWDNRGDLADLCFAAHFPLWRHRDHFRRVATDYWWRKSATQSTASKTGTGEVVLADAPGLTEAVLHLQQNVGQKKLVDANFRSFELFAAELKSRSIELVVIEGHVHPEARRAYDREGMQEKTRTALAKLAKQLDFPYIDQNHQPQFSEHDFGDAYHLNSSGRLKLTEILLSCLEERRATSDETRE